MLFMKLFSVDITICIGWLDIFRFWQLRDASLFESFRKSVKVKLANKIFEKNSNLE